MLKKIKKALAYWLKDELLKYLDIRQNSPEKIIILSSDEYTIETLQKIVYFKSDRIDTYHHLKELEFHKEELLEYAKTFIEQYVDKNDHDTYSENNSIILKLRVLKRK